MRFLHIRTKLGVKWCQSLLQRPLRFQTLIFQTEEILNWAIFVNGNLVKKVRVYFEWIPEFAVEICFIFLRQNVWVLRKTGLSVMQFDEFLNSIFVKSLWSWSCLIFVETWEPFHSCTFGEFFSRDKFVYKYWTNWVTQ